MTNRILIFACVCMAVATLLSLACGRQEPAPTTPPTAAEFTEQLMAMIPEEPITPTGTYVEHPPLYWVGLFGEAFLPLAEGRADSMIAPNMNAYVWTDSTTGERMFIMMGRLEDCDCWFDTNVQLNMEWDVPFEAADGGPLVWPYDRYEFRIVSYKRWPIGVDFPATDFSTFWWPATDSTAIRQRIIDANGTPSRWSNELFVEGDTYTPRP